MSLKIEKTTLRELFYLTKKSNIKKEQAACMIMCLETEERARKFISEVNKYPDVLTAEEMMEIAAKIIDKE